MNPFLPIPAADPLPLPAPVWLLQVLLVFTFILHVVPMNFVLGGSFLTAWSAWRASRGNAAHAGLLRQLVQTLPVVTAMAVTLGVAPLLFVQVLYGQFFFTSSILMATPWIAVIPMLIAAYYGFYYNSYSRRPAGSRHALVAIFSAILILCIGFIFSNNYTLMLTPERWREVSPSASTFGTSLNFHEPTLLPRYLHFVVAAFAVSGLGIALRGSFLTNKSARGWQVQYGVMWFLAATLVNVGAGLWFFFTLPDHIRQNFLGADPFSTGALWTGVALALVAMMLALLSVGSERPRWPLAGASASLLLAISSMATARHAVRSAYLAPHFDVSTLPVQPMWDVFAVFAVLLVVGLGVVAWMLRKLFGPTTAGTTKIAT